MSAPPGDARPDLTERADGADPLAVTGLIADTVPFSLVDGPGNRFAVFLQGCNMDCVACHNPQTIPGHAPVEGHHPVRRTVGDVLGDIRRAAPFIGGVTVSGGEATQQPAFLAALFEAIESDADLRRLSCLVDSNGACDPSVWDRLAPVFDGAMIDLKCLDPDIHRRMTGVGNDQVLRSIEHLRSIDRLAEVRLLILRGVNDAAALIDATAGWLARVDPTMRVKVIGFRSHGARPHDPPLEEPTLDDLESIVGVLRGAGDFTIELIPSDLTAAT